MAATRTTQTSKKKKKNQSGVTDSNSEQPKGAQIHLPAVPAGLLMAARERHIREQEGRAGETTQSPSLRARQPPGGGFVGQGS